MKAITVLIIVYNLFFTITLAFAGNFQAGAEPNGFRDLQWAQDISTVKGMVLTKESRDKMKNSNPASLFYTRNNDILTIGSAKVEEIVYEFWFGKFFAVEIICLGEGNYKKLKEATIASFGGGFTSDKVMHWYGEKSCMSIYPPQKNRATLSIWSSVIVKAQDTYIKEKNIKERGF
jgi:hypothetical protein